MLYSWQYLKREGTNTNHLTNCSAPLCEHNTSVQVHTNTMIYYAHRDNLFMVAEMAQKLEYLDMCV